jgi:LPS-assembly protein
VTSCPSRRSGTKLLSTAFALTALLGAPAPSLAESVSTAEWDITADRIIRYEDPNSIVAEGQIVLEKRVKLPPRTRQQSRQQAQWADLLGETVAPADLTAGQVEEATDEAPRYETEVVIEADWLRYDVEKKLIKARGNVRITGKNDTLTADAARVDLNDETGTFTDAVIIRKEEELHLEGKTIEKTGFNTYHIVDGWAVTCKVNEGETPPWSFASSDTRIKEGGYAVMKNATFNIKGVPIFYTPYMVVPVKNTRQSGLLMPEFSFSQAGGFSVDTPFFWNISDSMDMTFFPEVYFDRGVMPGAEFRYSIDDRSRGTLIGSYMDDDLSGEDKDTDYYSDTDYTHSNSERYWIRAKADHEYNDWVGRLDLDIVSDRDYLKEFNKGYTGFNKSEDRFLSEFGRGFDNKTEETRQNLMTTLKSWEGMSLQANLLGYNDLRDADARSQDDDPLWTLPQVNFAGILPIGTSGVSFNWVNDYVNYWREDGIGGNRVDLHPSISSSIPLSPYLESRAELGIRETFYAVEEYGDAEWTNDDTQNRLLADFEYEVGTPLMRSFDLSSGNTLDHRLRPYVKYNYIPDVDQDDLPDFDSVDQIDETSLITYGVDNFFSGIFDSAERDIGYVEVYQGYDLLDDAEEEFTDVTMRLRLLPLQRLFVEYETDYDVHGEGFVRHSFETRFTNSRGDYLAVDYSFQDPAYDGVDIDQLNFYAKARLLPQWYTRVEVEHSITEDETNLAQVALLYTAPCWSVEFETEYTPEDTKFLVVFNLANIGNPMGLDL